jgi:gliding motility-associated-like protein
MDNFDATIDMAGPFCSDADPVTLTAASEGGTWSGPGIDPESGEFDPSEAGAGTHTITYEMLSECGDSDDIQITVNQAADASINQAGPFCENDEPLVLSAAEPGGTWSGTAIDSSSGFFDPEIAGPGDHLITYEISGTCGDSDEITISVLENYNADIKMEATYCSSDGLIELESIMDGGDWILDGNEITDTFMNTEGIDVGEHELIHVAEGLCGDSDTLIFTIHESANATIDSLGKVYLDDPVIVLNTAESGGFWSGNAIDPATGAFSPADAGVGEHLVIYTIETVCGDTDSITIEVLPKLIEDLRLPDVLTPNGDGYNDTWRIQGIEAYQDVQISIFNRWGDQIFSFSGSGDSYADSDNQWDGRYNGKDQPVGNYVYVVRLGENETMKGTLSIIR